eukprot:3770160-Alexandrium_andersonii.AAC.1
MVANHPAVRLQPRRSRCRVCSLTWAAPEPGPQGCHNCFRPVTYLEKPRPDGPLFAAPGEEQLCHLAAEQREQAR